MIFHSFWLCLYSCVLSALAGTVDRVVPFGRKNSYPEFGPRCTHRCHICKGAHPPGALIWGFIAFTPLFLAPLCSRRQAYSAASTCAPSRYALFTGRWPARAPATATFVRDLLPNVKLPDDCEGHHHINGTVRSCSGAIPRAAQGGPAKGHVCSGVQQKRGVAEFLLYSWATSAAGDRRGRAESGL